MPERKTNSTNYINQSFLETKCALNEVIHLLSKRWITEVLFSIEEGNNRFSSIKDDLKLISDHILADRLKLLEEYSLIKKTQLTDNSGKIEYTMTPTGSKLSTILDQLCKFGEFEMGLLGD